MNEFGDPAAAAPDAPGPATGTPPTAPHAVSPALREPVNQVSPRAVPYWMLTSALGSILVLGALGVGWYFWRERPWWATALLAVVAVVALIEVFVAPRVRFRVHRWEVTDEAIFTRSGWLSREQRIAPLSRVQTVDSNQGVLMRVFGLAQITVTTASAAGPITITGLAADVARRTVAELTEITAAAEGDAT